MCCNNQRNKFLCSLPIHCARICAIDRAALEAQDARAVTSASIRIVDEEVAALLLNHTYLASSRHKQRRVSSNNRQHDAVWGACLSWPY